MTSPEPTKTFPVVKSSNFMLKVYLINDFKDKENNDIYNVSKIPSDVKKKIDNYFKNELDRDLKDYGNENPVTVDVNYGDKNFVEVKVNSTYPIDYVDKSKGINNSLMDALLLYRHRTFDDFKGSDGLVYKIINITIHTYG